MGYSRQQFYEIRRNFQTYGAHGLIDRLPGAGRAGGNTRLVGIKTQIEPVKRDIGAGQRCLACLWEIVKITDVNCFRR